VHDCRRKTGARDDDDLDHDREEVDCSDNSGNNDDPNVLIDASDQQIGKGLAPASLFLF